MSTTFPSINWSPATPYGIQLDPTNQVWASGRVLTALPIDSNRFLIGTEQGGVWLITQTDPSSPPVAQPLSDTWDDPNIAALVAGPDSPHHVYAGTTLAGSVWVTDLSASEPLFAWRQIADLGKGLIYGIAVFKNKRRIVLTTDNAVLWADIPSQFGTYKWTRAIGVPGGAYFGVAAGAADTVVVGAWNFGTGSQGILVGTWESGDLKMAPATINGANFRTSVLTAVSVASCAAQPENMYALCHSPKRYTGPEDPGGSVLAVLRSTDNGQNWSPTGNAISGMPPSVGKDITNISSQVNGGWFKTIGVSPFDPQTVAIPGRYPLLSRIGGTEWGFLPFSSRIDAQGNFIPSEPNHLHEDTHFVHFDATDPRQQRLYVGTDGGIVVSNDFGNTLDSIYNQGLTTLLFQSEPERNLFGEFTVSSNPTLLAGALQDNGVVYCTTQPTTGPWLKVGDGDGQSALLLGDDLLWMNNSSSGGIQRTRVNAQVSADLGTIPVTRPKPGSTFQNGLPGSSARVFQALVTAPVRRNAEGHLLQAVAAVNLPNAVNGDVYGLFVGSGETPVSWEYLGSIPVIVWSIASYDGVQIFLGTTDGRIFLLNPDGSSETMQMTPLISSNSTVGHLLLSVTYPQLSGYALVSDNGSRTGRLLSLSNGSVLANQGAWVSMNTPTANDPYYDIAVDWGPPTNLYVASDSQVYVTVDDGFLWESVTEGLPKRPHCSRLRLLSGSGGKLIYLSTYGRSAWVGVISPPESSGGTFTGTGGSGPILPPLPHHNRPIPFT